MRIEEKLKTLGITLPPFSPPLGAYLPSLVWNNLLFLSGQLSPSAHRGRVGVDLSMEDGKQAARGAMLQALAVAQKQLGSLDRVKRVLKVTGYVATTPDFSEHPKVINGASELLEEIFGEAGKHTRCALGVVSLPHNSPVEIEVWFEVEES